MKLDRALLDRLERSEHEDARNAAEYIRQLHERMVRVQLLLDGRITPTQEDIFQLMQSDASEGGDHD